MTAGNDSIGLDSPLVHYLTAWPHFGLATVHQRQPAQQVTQSLARIVIITDGVPPSEVFEQVNTIATETGQ